MRRLARVRFFFVSHVNIATYGLSFTVDSKNWAGDSIDTMDTDSHRSTADRSLTTSPASSGPETHRSGGRWPAYLATDLVLVVVFAGIGRSSHGESLSGIFVTAWPFLVGALLGWLACRGTRHPAAVIPTGLSVWLCAEVGGMVLRTLTGQGTALPFVVVSAVTLAVFLIGYRLVLTLVRHLRSR